MPKKIIYIFTLILTALALASCSTSDKAALFEYRLKLAKGETQKTLKSSFNLDSLIKGKTVKWELDTPNKNVIRLEKTTVVVEPGDSEVAAVLKATYEDFYREFELVVPKSSKPAPQPGPQPQPNPDPAYETEGDPEPEAPLTPLVDLKDKLSLPANDPKFKPHSTKSDLVGHKTRIKGKYITSSNAPLMNITMLEEEVPYISVKNFFKGLDGIVDFNQHKYEYVYQGHKYELVKKMEIEETKTKTIVKLVIEFSKIKPESQDLPKEEYTFIYEHTAQRFIIGDAVFLQEVFSYNEAWNEPEPAYANYRRTKLCLLITSLDVSAI